MNPEAAEKARQAFELETCDMGTQDEVPIKGKLETLVHRTDPVPDPPAPEHGLLRNIVEPFDGLAVVRRERVPADLAALFVDVDPMTVDHINLGLGAKSLRHVCEGPRKERVIAVEVTHDLAA